MENLFIQFYQTVIKRFTSPGSFLEQGTVFHLLTNGFSYVWDYANPVWVELDRGFREVKPTRFSENQNVYVSASFFEHAFVVLEWAKENPQTNFFVGGPAIPTLKTTNWLYKLPQNVRMLNTLAETIFNLPLDPKRFKIEVPDLNVPRVFNFHIEDGCYWGKCKFCVYNYDKGGEIGFDLDTLSNVPPGGIWLGTSSLSPKNCEILTQLNYEERRYHSFLRGDKLILEILQRIMPRIKEPSRLRFLIGVEFPSNRMFKIMNKGTDTDTLSKVITILVEAGCKVTLDLLTGWGCLEKEDIKEAEEFFRMLPDSTKYDAGHVRLQNWFGGIPADTENSYPFFVKLSKQQEELDRQWRNILQSNRAESYEVSKAGRMKKYLTFIRLSELENDISSELTALKNDKVFNQEFV